jgi:hypothetical protein
MPRPEKNGISSSCLPAQHKDDYAVILSGYAPPADSPRQDRDCCGEEAANEVCSSNPDPDTFYRKVIDSDYHRNVHCQYDNKDDPFCCPSGTLNPTS